MTTAPQLVRRMYAAYNRRDGSRIGRPGSTPTIAAPSQRQKRIPDQVRPAADASRGSARPALEAVPVGRSGVAFVVVVYLVIVRTRTA
ncbi:hypothetical protein JNW90_07205 [Micromonospora sp. STR1s_5]|nr:hypothetical protein [Micromonospora sp. STR1s_5]